MPAPKNSASAEVTERRDLTSELMIIKIKPSIPFPFKPGQYCTIGVEDTERPYSIVSAPHEPCLELFIELVPEKFRTEKSLTPRLWRLSVGDTVSLRPSAKGVFTLDEACDTHAMISTVTGIAPFVSMIRARIAGYYKGNWNWCIFQGASYKDDFGYFEELSRHSDAGLITYVPTVSRPQEERNSGWQGETGRVNLIIEKHFTAFGIGPEGTTCYLCGNEGMVKYLGNKKPAPDKPLGLLIEKGFRIKEEVFF